MGTDFVISGGPEPVELLQDGSLGEMMIKELKLRPSNIGLIDPVSGRELTYRQILQYSCRVANGLRALGLRKTDTVAIVSENCLEYCFAMFGTIFVGCPLAQFNPPIWRENLNMPST